jgi:hypothetical protein
MMEVDSTGSGSTTASPGKDILELFAFGFDSWLAKNTRQDVLDRLALLDEQPLGRAQFNQLLHLCHEPGISEGFFRYYWLSTPEHPYDVTMIHGYHPSWVNTSSIESLDQFRWGIYRLYVDALLYFGDVRTAYHSLRTRSEDALKLFFISKRYDTDYLKRRGPAMRLQPIAKDTRYLISEMACKSYATPASGSSDLRNCLLDAFESHNVQGGGKVTIRKLFELSKKAPPERQGEFLFSADDILNDEVQDRNELEQKYDRVFAAFQTARQSALINTDYFLSMVNELDVYVATSMRDREDFRKMGDFCEHIFRNPTLVHLNLRYFDPTMSAAEGHEDKGLIECLMVKSAKVLVYCAGKRDSFGKDAEAAMALSLGKPVIFYCDEQQRGRFFSEVHPLSRLIQFETGVAVGAMVTSSEAQVVELLSRILQNRMEYDLEQKYSGLRLIERLTGSTVRLQTKNKLLRETFWNYYHSKG